LNILVHISTAVGGILHQIGRALVFPGNQIFCPYEIQDMMLSCNFPPACITYNKKLIVYDND